MKVMKKLSFLGAALATLLSAPSFSSALELSEGTMSVGGTALLRYDNTDINQNNTNNNVWRFQGQVSFGYFAMDNMPLNFYLGGGLNNFRDDSSNFDIGVGTAYYFDCDSAIFPYIGVDLFFQLLRNSADINVETAGTGNVFSLPFGPRVGILAALNEHVALDFGVQALFGAPLSGQDWTVTVPMGFVGVKTFF